MQNTVTLHITALGGLGDGIAEYEGKRIYVPYTTEGDVVTARIGEKTADGYRGHLIEVNIPSPRRQAAPCPYFAECGGCDLQHLSNEDYSAFKLSRAKQALAEAGYDPALLTLLHRIPVASRRRAEFKIDGPNLGFFKGGTNEVVPIDQCLILAPAIDALIQPLAALVKNMNGIKTISLTKADNTLDMFVKCSKPLDEISKNTFVTFAKIHMIGRLTENVGDKTIVRYLSEMPVVTNGTTPVELPVGAFLQASHESQELLTNWVVKQVGKKKRVLDIFSGIGTYSLPLAEKGLNVTAYEGSREMVDTLNRAAKQHGIRSLKAEVVDLVKNPVDIETLSAANCIVINPPRPGAAAQTRTIAASSLKEVVMVSCNPASFARDAKMLHKAGFRITNVEALDQFTYSTHLEIMAKFVRN
ncbi:MAG: class I SAM-dependent RNA methyltransferase [Proteobacteria bacterium]|nr:class I SAM-dependent RNA methyltransferase [Pseudomonadota bacterium]